MVKTEISPAVMLAAKTAELERAYGAGSVTATLIAEDLAYGAFRVVSDRFCGLDYEARRCDFEKVCPPVLSDSPDYEEHIHFGRIVLVTPAEQQAAAILLQQLRDTHPSPKDVYEAMDFDESYVRLAARSAEKAADTVHPTTRPVYKMPATLKVYDENTHYHIEAQYPAPRNFDLDEALERHFGSEPTDTTTFGNSASVRVKSRFGHFEDPDLAEAAYAKAAKEFQQCEFAIFSVHTQPGVTSTYVPCHTPGYVARTELWDNYRRMVPGEVTRKGDMIKRDESLASAPLGVLVTIDTRELYVRDHRELVEASAVHRAMARYCFFVLNRAYLIENFLTDDLTSRRCRGCRAKGSVDIAYADDEETPPDELPLRYQHKPDCPALWFTDALQGFHEVFSAALESRGVDLFAAAKFTDDDDEAMV